MSRNRQLCGGVSAAGMIRTTPPVSIDDATDLTARIGTIACPTLLLWGDADAVSPVAVGERLRRLLPASRLRVFAGAGHDLIRTHARDVAAEIAAHLGVSR
jgi:pimeloyl-ACP methyl ester carboxylesterase